MADTNTFFAQISCFFWAFCAYVLRLLSLKPRLKTHSDDLEVGISSDPVKRPVQGHFNADLPVVSGSCSTDRFVDVNLNPDSKIQEAKAVPIAPHDLPLKATVSDTDHSCHLQPTVKSDRIIPVSFPAIPVIIQIQAVDIRNKHRAFQFDSSSVYKLPEDHSHSNPRKRPDSFSDLLDQFPAPPTHIPLLLPPVINRDVVFPATNVRSRARSQSLFTYKPKAPPRTYCDVVDSPKQADLQKGDISKDKPSKEREERVDTSASILEDHISRGAKYEAELQSLHDSLVSLYNLENSSDQPLDKHTSIRAPVQVVPAVPTKWTRPVVAPLRIVKKNKVRSIVAHLKPLVAHGAESGNWEQAMDNVLQAFRDAEMESQDFRDLFYGDNSFVSQSSVINAMGHDEGDLDGHEQCDGDCEGRLEDSFDSIEKSVDENLSMLRTPPDLVALNVEDLASVSLSSERTVVQQIMEVKDEFNNMDLPVLRFCDCEGYEDSYSWTAATDDDDDDDDDDNNNHSQEDDQWSDKLELDDYAS